jgi:uncharacterized protein YbjT (DUF2867 family)
MTFVVAGVSGHTGAVVADTLLDQGQPVRVIVRDRAKAHHFAARGAEVAIADLADEAALARAFAGASGAFVLVPPNMQAQDFAAYQRAIVTAIAGAADKTKLPHLVLLSSVGAQHGSGNGPIAGLYEAEQRFRELPATKCTFVRASSFMENLGGSLGMLGQGIVPSFMPADFSYDMVSTHDIGKVAATALLEGAKETTVIELGGPPRSMKEVAAILTELVGTPIRVQEAPLSAVAPTFQGFGMSADLATKYAEMVAGIQSRRVDWEGGHRRLQGTTGLREVLSGLLGK